MASYAASSSSSNSYHVFLNFRGKDTRYNFLDRLYEALDRAGVNAFKDSKELRTGDNLESLFAAIEHSRMSITIFSKNYASSHWCLKELAKIVQCHKTNYQLVLPVFLDVEPGELRSQEGSFAKAFKKHKKYFEQEPVEKWKEALTEVAKLIGRELKQVENRDESKLVQLVVKDVLNELNLTPLFVAKHPTGIDSLVHEFKSYLGLEYMDRRFVGIVGQGGIGKSTIAKATYNNIYKQFHGSSFLENIQERALQPRGLICLQKQLLHNVSGKQNFDIDLVDRGKELIKQRLPRKKVLIILDDVDQLKELDAIAGDLNWFGPGSRIIITTRNQKVFDWCQLNDKIYKPEFFVPQFFDDTKSLQLFCEHAFGEQKPKEGYLDLTKQVVGYAEGLPLTLEVLGTYLRETEGKKLWIDTLRKFKKFPPDGIYKTLKISYDGLEDTEKEIFLDIACFFIGMDRNLATTIWEGCEFFPEIGLDRLIKKSLVRISEDNKLGMQNQLRDMGKKIVHEESPKEPGKCSRLWSYDKIMQVINERKGTDQVEGIVPDSLWKPGDCLKIDNLKNMHNLRLLQVNGVNLEGEIMDLPSSKLIWLSWQSCPSEIILSNFCLEKLVILDLSGSNSVWDSELQDKQFKHLKVLDLSNCLNLTKTPNFSGFPKLERLILKGCKELSDIESISQSESLTHLDLTGCMKLSWQLFIPMPKSLKKLVVDSNEWSEG